VSSPRIKNISLNTSGKSPLGIRPSHPTRGVAHVTNARWDAMDATASGAQLQPQGEMNLVSGMRRADGRRFKTVSTKLAGWVRGPARASARQARTAKWCGPDAPRLASSRVEMHPAQPGRDASAIRKATVARVHGSPRRSPISRNPLCRESRMIRFTCGLLVRLLYARPRVPSAPGFPCALLS
jgi:hypothetical protein